MSRRFEDAPDAREALEEALEYRFSDRALLDAALTHPSFANDEKQRGRVVADNQRLEFLGDGLVNLLVGEILFESFPADPEGSLSRMQSRLVSEPHLARVGRRIGLGSVLKLSYGEKRSGGAERASAIADAMEALLAAVYLDGGFDAVRGVVRRLFGEDAEGMDPAELSGPLWKSALQEKAQAEGFGVPTYELVDASGPDHERRFVVEVSYAPGVSARGEGRTKKAAEISAARGLMEQLSQAT